MVMDVGVSTDVRVVMAVGAVVVMVVVVVAMVMIVIVIVVMVMVVVMPRNAPVQSKCGAIARPGRLDIGVGTPRLIRAVPEWRTSVW